MKFILPSILALAAMLPLAAKASWLDGDPFAPAASKASPVDVREMEMKDGFGAQFWLIPVDKVSGRWFQLNIHKLVAVGATRKNNPVSVAVFFVNPKAAEAFIRQGQDVVKMSVVNVTFDLKVTRPDGVVDLHAGLPAWQGVAPPPYLIRIAQARATITFDVEPAGSYKIQVVVHDRVRKVDIKLEHSLMVYE